jgi:hypothetical protein
MTKRIAIQLFGHLRSFQRTCRSLEKYVILPNKKNGCQVDIFIHTWDELEHTDTRLHYVTDKRNRGKPLTDAHREFVKNIINRMGGGG